MGVETFVYIDDFNVNWPLSTDKRRFGDDHLRGIKLGVKNTFPNIDGPVNPTPAELNYSVGVTDLIQDQLDLKLETSDIADLADKTVQNSFTAGQATLEDELTYAATIQADAAVSNAFSVVLAGDCTLLAPLNGIRGQVVTIFIQQDNVGSRVMTFVGLFGDPTDDLVLSTGPNKLDLLTLISGTADNRWYIASLKKDINNAL
jgi:hypothetical protein